MRDNRKKEIRSIKWFNKGRTTQKDIEMFFDYSERGIKPEKETVGYKRLLEGKRWRNIHVGMYEEGILDGTMPYIEIFKGVPKAVKEFMAKTMFQGKDYDTIIKGKECFKC